MAVTMETAQKAVDRWQLDGGWAVNRPCGCVTWAYRPTEDRELLMARVVKTCLDHRIPLEWGAPEIPPRAYT